MTPRLWSPHGLLIAALLLLLVLPSGVATASQPWDLTAALPPPSQELVYQGACNPRPRVNVQSAKIGENAFRVTITAGQGNLELIRFGNEPDARVDLPGVPPGRVPPFDYKPPLGTTYTFDFHADNVGGTVTLPLTIYDGCGQGQPWNTFVGAGQAATQAQLSIADASVTEGNTGTTNLVFTVTLGTPASVPVTVQYATADGTAKAPADYIATNGLLAFAVGETSKTITVQVKGDTVDESNETFTVTLSNATGASIRDGTATGTINDDENAPTVSLSLTGSPLAENGGQATVTASLSGTTSQPVTVSLNFTGTADFPGDYTRTGTEITIPANQLTGTIGLQSVQDGTDEPNETVIVTITNATNAIPAAPPNNQVTATITDGSAAPKLSIENVIKAEGNSGTDNALFTVTLSPQSGQTVTVQYQTADGSAQVSDQDYLAASGSLTFNPGDTSKPITVTVNGDTKFESDESFTIMLLNPTNAGLDQGTATGTITNDDAVPPGTVTEPDVQVSDASAVEGANAVFIVSLSAPATATVTVNFTTADGTATAGTCAGGADYVAQSGMLTFNVGDPTIQTITVVTCDNAAENPNKSFFVNLTGSSANAHIVDNQGEGTIIDNEGTPSLTILPATGSEGTTPRTFTVQVSPTSSSPISVSYATADNTATGGASCASPNVDYVTIAPTTLNIPANAATATIDVTICDDPAIEPTETFFVNLSSPTGAVIADGQASGSITNNDVGVSIDDVAVVEGDAAGTATFTVSLSDPAPNQVTVSFSTGGGAAIGGACATPGVDYVTATGTVTFATGESTQPIVITICNDASDEQNETFNVTLSSPTGGAALVDPEGTGTIIDDDGLPSLSIDDVTVTEGNAATVTADFTVTLSPAINQPVTVSFATANGVANGGVACGPGVDYVSQSGTLNFVANDTSETISITFCDDALDEVDERFFVNLLVASPNATIVDGQGIGTITDDDAEPTLSIGDATAVTEGNAATVTVDFTVTLSAAAGVPVTVQFITANDTAVGSAACGAGVDYVNDTDTLTFVPGDTSETISITFCDDALDEPNETFFVNLAGPSNAAILDGQGVGTINDDDATPTLSIGDFSAQEGNSGTTSFVFDVTLSAASGQTVTATYATTDGTATGEPSCATTGADYLDATGTVTFTPGDTSQPITITVCGDTTATESGSGPPFNETFTVDLSAPSNAAILDGQGTGIILDDDNTPTFSVSNVSLAEGTVTPATTTFQFTVSLSQAQATATSIDYATANGTATGGAACATAGVDFISIPTTALNFAINETTKTVNVTVCADALFEGSNETFTLVLSNPNPGTLAVGQPGQGTILDDDPQPTISIGDANVAAEGNTGATTTASFTVSLSGASSQTVTVSYATAANTATEGTSCATAGADYDDATGTVTFIPGDTSETVTITVCGDATDELNETFFVNLSTPANATILDSQGIGTITDDDPTPTISIGDLASIAEGNGTTTSSASFTVSLSNPSFQTITVAYATTGGTATEGATCATAGADYAQASGTATFTPGDTSETIAVTICGDDLDEANETFFVNLSNPTNSSILDPQATGTIVDDDPPPIVHLSLTTPNSDGKLAEEGGLTTGTGTVTATLKNAGGQTIVSGLAVTVPLSFTGTAQNVTDYTRSDATISIPAGSSTGTITLTAVDDDTAQADLTIIVTINNPTNATAAAAPNNSVTATIVDNDPIAVADAYAATGNLSITVPVGTPGSCGGPTSNQAGVLCNDTLRGATLAASTITSTNGGTVIMAADGSFSYEPPAGFTGSDTFTYTVNRASPPGKATGTVTVAVSNMIWFINRGAPACALAAGPTNPNNCGRLSKPLTSIADMQTLNSAAVTNGGRANHVIFIYENATAYIGSLTLLNGQKLVGQDSTIALGTVINTAPNAFTLAATSPPLPTVDSANPTFVTLTTTAPNSSAVTVASGNTIRGMRFGNVTNTAITGSSFGSLVIKDALIDTTGGRALGLSNGTLDATFASLRSINSPSEGINLSSLGASSNLTVSGATTVDNPGNSFRSINIDTAGAGSTFSFQAINLGTRKSDGLRLNAVQGTVTAVDVTQSGTQPATGAGVLVSSSSAAVTFKSVTQTGGLNGISLSSTTGSFTITGDGASARNGTGGTIASSTGDGIRLATATKVSLSRMNINTSGSQGIFGTGVNGFVLDWASMTGNGNAVKEGAIRFGHETDNGLNGLIGTGPAGTNPTKIANSFLTGSHERNVSIFNSSGTLTQLDVDNNTIQNAVIGSGFLVETRSSATATVIVTRSTFQNNFAVGIQGSATDQSNLTLKVQGVSATDPANRNTFTNNNEGVLCSNRADADATCEISNNMFTEQGGNAIFVGNGINLSNQAALNGRIQNNSVTQPFDSANANHAVQSFLSGIGAVSKLVISGNTVASSGQHDAIHVNTPDTGTSPNIHVTVTGNNASIGAAGVNAINLNARQSSTACFKVETNTTAAPSGIGVQVRQVSPATVSLEKGNSTSTVASTVLTANNPSAGGSTPTFVGGTVAVVNNGTCQTPP